MPRKKDVTESMIDIFPIFKTIRKSVAPLSLEFLKRASAVCWPRCSEAMKTLTLS